MNPFSDNPHWLWNFKHGIDWKTLLSLYYPSRPNIHELDTDEEIQEFLHDVLESIGQWSEESISKLNKELDKHGAGEVKEGETIPSQPLAQLYKEATQREVLGLNVPARFGGLEAPTSIQLLAIGLYSYGSQAACAQLSFFTVIADMIHKLCPEEFHEKDIPRIVAGELSGSMCLTEPGTGSDLGAIKTIARPQEDGTYLLDGTKMFITNAGGGVAFVLAKTPDAQEGLDGLSLFYLHQKGENGEQNFKVTKNEDKMGMHGTFTCEVVYEKSRGHIIGKEGEGFQHMLELMNEARIATGLQALGGLEAVYKDAKDYAHTRQQFGRPIAELPLMKRNLSDMETEIQALTSFCFDTISHYDIYQFLKNKKQRTNDLTDEEEKTLKENFKITRRRTPLIKYMVTEAYSRISTKGVQVFGGYGYMREYPMEQHHRDSFGPLLYEGTSQIQALMAMKDILKSTMKDPAGTFLSYLKNLPVKSSLGNEVERGFGFLKSQFQTQLYKLIIKTLKPEEGSPFQLENWSSQAGADKMTRHAETICQALGHVEILEVLKKQAELNTPEQNERKAIYERSLRLFRPRLEAIYTDWGQL